MNATIINNKKTGEKVAQGMMQNVLEQFNSAAEYIDLHRDIQKILKIKLIIPDYFLKIQFSYMNYLMII